eukprot:TRINITY_DN80274_c0_g1_i1.p1 TRINITY_DN80274_c0_g1~~TRINITY_DN80274_c0_g1_i1.p1  ORF type:complete len:247 (+),score=43.23 TRINITY_DN80274_c0_g1_i1:84-824(+)
MGKSSKPRGSSSGKRKAIPQSEGSKAIRQGGKGEKTGWSGQAKNKVPAATVILDDSCVAEALAEVLPPISPGIAHKPAQVFQLMRLWAKPILKANIPGMSTRPVSKAMLDTAKREVLRFYQQQQALGDRSNVVEAFYLATGEVQLRFDWTSAMAKVKRASFDRHKKIDSWEDCLAMTSGESNARSEIYVCGTRRLTQRALNSLLCHEGLHNLARRARPGNPFLSEELEHMAMALIGDPQLVHEHNQ